MKTLTTALLVTTAALSAANVEARERDHRHHDRQHHGDVIVVDDHRSYKHRGHDHAKDRRNDRRYDRRHKGHQDKYQPRRIRLDLPLHIRGDARIRIGKLIRRQYGLDLADYRLVKVVVNNRSRYDAGAAIRVGKRRTGYIPLDRGRNHIPAPRGAGWGSWVLKLDNVRTNNVRVVIEPRHQYARHTHRDRWNDHRAWRHSEWKRDRFHRGDARKAVKGSWH